MMSMARAATINSSRLAIAILLASFAAQASAADQPKPLFGTVIVAATTIFAAFEEGAAVMNHCREVDPTNADLYDGLVMRLLAIYRPVYDQIDRLLPVEAVRAGRDEKFYLRMLPGMR